MPMKFPDLPPAKIYGELMTPEQTVIHKLIQRQEITKEEEDILREAIEYYKQLYPFLKNIDLSIISEEDAVELKRYTERAINTIIYPKNTIRFPSVFRVTLVRDAFLQDGKIRETKFVSFPPLETIKEQGIYGRANSPDSTVFYCAFHPGVAVLETKPKVGDRIILTEWENFENKPFVSSPVTNNKTIDNEGLKAATAAFEETKKYNHPFFAEIMDLYFEFFSSELVKDGEVRHPKKYEYLFSGLFADRALDYGTDEGQEDQAKRRNVDCLIYPSVANQHRSENLAIVPDAISALRPRHMLDAIVTETLYDNPDVTNGRLPIRLNVLRRAIDIYGGANIKWSDD